MVIALKLGQEQSKEQILEGYLNTVYFGRGAYGLAGGVPGLLRHGRRPGDRAAGDRAGRHGQQRPACSTRPRATSRPATSSSATSTSINSLVKMGKMTEADKATIYTALPAVPGDQEGPALRRHRRLPHEGGHRRAQAARLRRGHDQRRRAQGRHHLRQGQAGRRRSRSPRPRPRRPRPRTARTRRNSARVRRRDRQRDRRRPRDVRRQLRLRDDQPQLGRPRRAATGSTFKTWSLVAALRQGVSLDKQLKGYTFTRGRRHAGPGEPSARFGPIVSLRTPTTHSVNTAFVDLVHAAEERAAATIQAANDAGIPGTASNWAGTPTSASRWAPRRSRRWTTAAGYETLANDGVRRRLARRHPDQGPQRQGRLPAQPPTTPGHRAGRRQRGDPGPHQGRRRPAPARSSLARLPRGGQDGHRGRRPQHRRRPGSWATPSRSPRPSSTWPATPATAIWTTTASGFYGAGYPGLDLAGLHEGGDEGPPGADLHAGELHPLRRPPCDADSSRPSADAPPDGRPSRRQPPAETTHEPTQPPPSRRDEPPRPRRPPRRPRTTTTKPTPSGIPTPPGQGATP